MQVNDDPRAVLIIYLEMSYFPAYLFYFWWQFLSALRSVLVSLHEGLVMRVIFVGFSQVFYDSELGWPQDFSFESSDCGGNTENIVGLMMFIDKPQIECLAVMHMNLNFFFLPSYR